MLSHLNRHLEQGLLPETQCGFRQCRSSADMIFAMLQLQENYQLQNATLHTTFVHLTTAFDTVYKEGLWKIIFKFASPDKFDSMVREFYDGVQRSVQDESSRHLSEYEMASSRLCTGISFVQHNILCYAVWYSP